MYYAHCCLWLKIDEFLSIIEIKELFGRESIKKPFKNNIGQIKRDFKTERSRLLYIMH